ncbi:PREDICTED: B-box domain protein 31-like [Lupinus angustifolius]|uniref:B-box domain protein 31-like n=1 Tax=Lupinus angustifolius TaxID=3871 RepID=UPI00092E87D5|nr:PREDICTED: B-box domain protein 31-like [Lupinus angustifolius]
MEEQCELCEKKAMVHCDSDQANLCWGCDAIVHSANFLVEKHMRILLCRICNSHTQWKACGSKLIPSASLCHRCMVDDDGGNSSDDVESDSEDDDSEKEDEEENQVVPLYSPLSLDSAASALNTQPGEEAGCSTSSEMHSATAALPSGEESSSVSSLRPRLMNQRNC